MNIGTFDTAAKGIYPDENGQAVPVAKRRAVYPIEEATGYKYVSKQPNGFYARYYDSDNKTHASDARHGGRGGGSKRGGWGYKALSSKGRLLNAMSACRSHAGGGGEQTREGNFYVNKSVTGYKFVSFRNSH